MVHFSSAFRLRVIAIMVKITYLQPSNAQSISSKALLAEDIKFTPSDQHGSIILKYYSGKSLSILRLWNHLLSETALPLRAGPAGSSP
jgi:hypothetical protein